MKKLIIVAAIIIGANFTFGQSLPKGSLFGLHMITINLNAKVTSDEFKTFFVNKVIPEYEKNWTGLKGYLVKSVRGEYSNKFAIVWLFESEAARDKYFNKDGTMNDLEKSAMERVKPIEEELKKYGTYTIKYMDDWVVQ